MGIGLCCSVFLHLAAFFYLSTVSFKTSTSSFLSRAGDILRISLAKDRSSIPSIIKRNKGDIKDSSASSKKSTSVGSNKKNALLIQGPMPVYPRPAKRRGIEGDVTLKIHIDDSGKPYLIEVADSSGYSILDQAAIDGVRKWRFNPVRKEGIKIASWITKRFSFRLN